MHTSPGGIISSQLLTNAIDDETLSPWVDVRGCSVIVFYLSGAGTTSSGVVTFEEAAPSVALKPTSPTSEVFGAATGDYSSIATNNASDVSGGKQKAIRATVAVTAYCFVRARISTVIGGGGSVSVGLVAY